MSEITFTETGFVAPTIIGPSYSTTYGYDFGGFFGPAGGSIAGDPFSIVWTGDGATNTVIDAVLTINNHSYDFGAGVPQLGNDFLTDRNMYQVEDGVPVSFNGGLSYSYVRTAYLSTGGGPGIYGGNGAFYIGLDDDASHDTQAFLQVLSVPAPVVGAGMTAALIFLCLWAAFWALARSSRYASSFHQNRQERNCLRRSSYSRPA